MKESKQKQLMAAARRIPPIEVPAGFSDEVVRVIRNGQSTVPASPSSVLDQVSALFPRLAAAALAVIVAAAAFEYFTGGDMAAQLTEASDQWLLPLDWL